MQPMPIIQAQNMQLSAQPIIRDENSRAVYFASHWLYEFYQIALQIHDDTTRYISSANGQNQVHRADTLYIEETNLKEDTKSNTRTFDPVGEKLLDPLKQRGLGAAKNGQHKNHKLNSFNRLLFARLSGYICEAQKASDFPTRCRCQEDRTKGCGNQIQKRWLTQMGDAVGGKCHAKSSDVCHLYDKGRN